MRGATIKPDQTFPRNDWKGVVFGSRPFRPIWDDHLYLATAAKLASDNWGLHGTKWRGLENEQYMLATADKLLEIALFYGRRWSPWPLPKTRAEWIELMKPDAELAMSLAENSKPLPPTLSRDTLQEFLFAALEVAYEPRCDAAERIPQPRRQQRLCMDVVERARIPRYQKRFTTGRQYGTACPKLAQAIYKYHSSKTTPPPKRTRSLTGPFVDNHHGTYV